MVSRFQFRAIKVPLWACGRAEPPWRMNKWKPAHFRETSKQRWPDSPGQRGSDQIILSRGLPLVTPAFSGPPLPGGRALKLWSHEPKQIFPSLGLCQLRCNSSRKLSNSGTYCLSQLCPLNCEWIGGSPQDPVLSRPHLRVWPLWESSPSTRVLWAYFTLKL